MSTSGPTPRDDVGRSSGERAAVRSTSGVGFPPRSARVTIDTDADCTVMPPNEPANEPEDAALFDRLATELGGDAQAVRREAPDLGDEHVLDRALRIGLARLRREVSQKTFAYLKWRFDRAVAAAATARADAASLRDATASTRAQVRADRVAAGPRTFVDAAFHQWSVREIAAPDPSWARRPHCLLFSSEMAVRRVWDFPTDWRTLTDAELEALSWAH